LQPPADFELFQHGRQFRLGMFLKMETAVLCERPIQGLQFLDYAISHFDTDAPTVVLIPGAAGISRHAQSDREAGRIRPARWPSWHQPATTRSGSGSRLVLGVATNGLDALRAIDANSPVMGGRISHQSHVFSGTGKRLGDVPIGSTCDGQMVSHTIKRAQWACGPHRCPIELTGAPIHQVTPF
jgi:hypothetical protein